VHLEPCYIFGDCALDLARFDAAIFEPFVTVQVALLPLDRIPIGRWREQQHALCGAPVIDQLTPFTLE
jgi:hypothetical protein